MPEGGDAAQVQLWDRSQFHRNQRDTRLIQAGIRVNINRSHPPHGGNVAAESVHKSSAGGSERRRDKTKAERPEAEERELNPTDGGGAQVPQQAPGTGLKSTHLSGRACRSGGEGAAGRT